MRHISQDTHQQKFEYQKLPVRERTTIEQLAIEIKANIRTTVQTSWEIGEKLVAARRQLDPYQFSSWLQAEFDWSRRTAYNFIHIYEAFPGFASANFARLNISVSALYLLAAPSTQPEIRHDFFNRALAGDRITHKVIHAAIRAVKVAPADHDAVMALRPDSQPQPPDREDAISSDLHPAWNNVDREFSLFWGDTTSPRFSERLPESAFVLAVPSRQWHHDWLVNESRSCIIITRSQLKQELVERLLSALTVSDTALIFPWLPDWKTIEIALNLNIKVYAGDPDLDRCQQTIAKLGLSKSKIERIRW